MTITRIAAAVTCAAAVVLGVVTVSGPTVPDEHWGTRGDVVNGLGLITFLGMAVACRLLVALLRPGRVGLGGVYSAQAGLVLMTVESLASELHGGDTLGPVFMLGLLLTLGGLLVLGIDGLRRPGARWLALLPLVAMLVGIGAGDRGGFLLLGAAWGGFALARPADRGEETAQPA